jgi:hypothetical protein
VKQIPTRLTDTHSNQLDGGPFIQGPTPQKERENIVTMNPNFSIVFHAPRLTFVFFSSFFPNFSREKQFAGRYFVMCAPQQAACWECSACSNGPRPLP